MTKKIRKSREELRVAVTQGKGKLHVDPRDKEEGYTYRWVNIGENNELKKEDLGYEPTTTADGSTQKRQYVAPGKEAVLMRIETDVHEEIQSIKQEENDELLGNDMQGGLSGGKLTKTIKDY